MLDANPSNSHPSIGDDGSRHRADVDRIERWANAHPHHPVCVWRRSRERRPHVSIGQTVSMARQPFAWKWHELECADDVWTIEKPRSKRPASLGGKAPPFTLEWTANGLFSRRMDYVRHHTPR